jgi:hypothetical protein
MNDQSPKPEKQRSAVNPLFRISGLGFPSGFGFRVSGLKVGLLV